MENGRLANWWDLVRVHMDMGLALLVKIPVKASDSRHSAAFAGLRLFPSG
jgi:hypothetical protein